MNLVATPARKNPYVGPRSLQPDEPIYGRTAEINDLRSLLVSHRLVLLYSPSGAGKTSLIEAGLRAALHDRGFAVTPVIRVGAELSPDLAAPDANRYRASVIASLDERLPPAAQLNDLGRATISLEDYLVRLDEEAPDRNPCLIFDQFEELFTLDPADSEAKAEFIAELGDALRNRTRWALFAMREDFIGQLDEYVDALPTSLRTRFRLGLLGPDAAAKAALGPAHAAGVQFDDDEAHKLVEELRQIQVQRLGEARSEPGPSVEPVQLQLVCRDLWSKLGDGHAIHIPTGAAGAGVDGALATYYEEEIASLTKDKLVSEHELRQWVDSKLISVDGFRQPVTEAPGKSDLVLEHLEDAHLVSRRSPRRSEVVRADP